MSKIGDAYAICCQLFEVSRNVISGRNVKTVGRYVEVNVKIGSSNSFRDVPNKKSPRIVGLRPPMCWTICLVGKPNANTLNILMHLQLL